MKKKLLHIALATALLPVFTGCIGNFEEYNTNPYEPHKLDPPLLFTQMITTGINVQQNDNQMIDQMVAGPYGGYLTMSTSWGGSNFNTYNQTDGWNQIPFNTPFEKFYPNYYKVLDATGGKGHYFAMAKLLRVNAMQRVALCYGPIPFSKMTQENSQVPYDCEPELYQNMFDDLNFAIAALRDYLSESSLKPLGANDVVYGGDYAKWLRFANSLKLRLALRIVNADEALARKMAEEAVSDAGGLIDSPEYNVMVAVGVEPNPFWLVANSWGEIRANATLTSYMNGYNDPRMAAYFTPATIDGEATFVGLRSGVKGMTSAIGAPFSKPNFSQGESMPMFFSSETAFLRAEGALRGWNMGGTAQELYEQGVTLSFTERGVSGVGKYLSDNTSTPEDYTSPVESSRLSYQVQTEITVAWEESAPFEEKLERIITQKWIANFPLGFEAWSDYRRTGYPEIFPVVDNLSNGVISTSRQQRRLPFPLKEKQANSENVKAAVSMLGGSDTGATDLWWAKKN